MFAKLTSLPRIPRTWRLSPRWLPSLTRRRQAAFLTREFWPSWWAPIINTRVQMIIYYARI